MKKSRKFLRLEKQRLRSLGGGDDSQNTQKQNMVISKPGQVLSMLTPLPLLQGAGLDLAKTLQSVDNKIP